MTTLFGIIQTLVICGTCLGLAFILLLSLPNSQLRTFLMPIVSWAIAVFSGVYILSPVDCVPEVVFGPFGLIDDLGALVAGIVAARTAMTANKG